MIKTWIFIVFVGMCSVAYPATFNISAGDSSALISAITNANANGQNDVINLAPGIYYLDHVEDSQAAYGESGLPEIAAGTKLAIRGPSLSRNGAPSAALVRLPPAKFRHLINRGNLKLDRVSLMFGISDSGWGGGAILNLGTMEITNCRITSNEAIEKEELPDIGGNGGGINNRGKMYVSRTTIKGNSAAGCGGGYCGDGRLTLSQSLVSENKSSLGGGLGIYYVDAEAKIVITNSTIIDNVSEGSGGALFVQKRVVELNHVTIAMNETDTKGGGVFNNQGTVRTRNTVIGNNFGPDSLDECSGSMQSLGYTVLSSDENCTFTSATGDVVGTTQNPVSIYIETVKDASLGNGYPGVMTFFPNSPVIDAIPASACGSNFDQSGFVRPAAATPRGTPRCDIGAYEMKAVPACLGVLGPFKATIVGTAGDDVLPGTSGVDVIHGLGGDDVIQGLDGTDIICGGTGNDTIEGNGGNDMFLGGDGDDHVEGGGANDIFWGPGEVGNNILVGGLGDDSINGGWGDDSIDGGAGTDKCNGGDHITQDTKANCETAVKFP